MSLPTTLPETNLLDIDISNTHEPFLIKIPDSLSGMRLDAAIASIIPELSRTRLTNWIKAGHVSINDKLVKPKDKVLGGEDVVVVPIPSDEVMAFTPEALPLDIVYQDDHILVINKPAGLTVHPGNGNWNGTLLNGLLYHYPALANVPRAGIVHRLDKNTSGLMVIAKTLLAQTNLVKQLQNRTVSRIYRAIVEGPLSSHGTINRNIGRDPNNRIKMAALEIGGKEAITHYRVLQNFHNFSYIECKLETGRTHQIRVHLKSINHPIVGDPVYGSKRINYAKEINDAINLLHRQALHALKLSLHHPYSGQILHFTTELASDIKNLLANLYLEHEAEYAKIDDEYDDNDNGWEVIYAKE